MHPDFYRLPLRPPHLAAVFEVAHQFLLLRIHRNHWLPETDILFNFRVDMFELRVAVRVPVPLFRLPVALQAVVQFMQQLSYHRVTHAMPHLFKIFRQAAHAPAGPSQTPFRIAPRRGLHQLLQIGHKGRILLLCRLAPTSRAANPLCGIGRRLRQFLQTSPDHLTGNACRPRHDRDTARPPRLTLGRNKKTPGLLVQRLAQCRETRLDSWGTIHASSIAPKHCYVEMLFLNSA
jgi:hypothetical protein